MGNLKNRGCEKYNEGNKRILEKRKNNKWATVRAFKTAVKAK